MEPQKEKAERRDFALLAIDRIRPLCQNDVFRPETGNP